MFLLIGLAIGCQSSTSVVEPGAALLQVRSAPAAPKPDELRVWVWDDSGAIWDNVRVPSAGSLANGNADELGTILVQPSSVRGSLRIHVRGLARGVRVSDGFVLIQSLAGGPRVFDIVLDTPAINDCPFVPSPDGRQCPTATDSAVADSAGARDVVVAEAPVRPETDTSAGGRVASGGTSGSSNTGGMLGRGGSGAGEGLGGASGGGGTRTGSGGTATAGATMSVGGAASTGGLATGGSPSTGGRGGNGDAGPDGASAFGGTTGTGGSTGGATSPPVPPLPGTACTTENAGGSCKTSDPVCYKYCGPERQGYKSLTCRGSKYIESDCSFSSTANYACYSVTGANRCAPPPKSGSACSITPCSPCGSSTGTSYYDTNNAAKTGYCVCSGGLWSCGSVNAWPCPGRKGC